MLKTNKKQHILALVMLSLTAVAWGAGFVLNDQLLSKFFYHTPLLFNTIRFALSAVLLVAIFCTKLSLDKRSLLYSALGGVFLFAAFALQVYGLKYTTPAHSGFFTAGYIVFVPFVVWAMCKKRPSATTLCGVVVAICGLAILNLNGDKEHGNDILLGDMITLASALMFSLQIVWSEISLQKGVDHYTFTTFQMCVAAILFALGSVAFEHGSYDTVTFEASYGIWRFAIVILFGTVFAYFSQTYSQQHLSSGETALIMGCESPIGAVLSLIVGADEFGWNIVIGGLLVIAAVVLVEVVPALSKKSASVDEQDNRDCTN